MKNQNPRFVFFGTPALAVTILNELKKEALTPSLVVTTPDKPQGRGMHVEETPVKKWALENGVPVLQPAKTSEILDELRKESWDVFVVVAYGKILPKTLLEIPKRGTLNVHPSLLPKLRGPSPIRSVILEDQKETGVSIMLLDEEMDHGPLIAQKKIEVREWPPYANELENLLAHEGGRLLATTLLLWISGDIESHEQNHDLATLCKKITKDNAYIDLSQDGYLNLLKIRGLEGLKPYAFFEKADKKIRVIITRASLSKDGSLCIERVTPEGKNEIQFDEFIRSGATLTNS